MSLDDLGDGAKEYRELKKTVERLSLSNTGVGGDELHPGTGDESMQIGKNAEAVGDRSTSLGPYTTAAGEGATALGLGAQAYGEDATALGKNADAPHDRSTAVGTMAATWAEDQVMLGSPFHHVVVPSGLLYVQPNTPSGTGDTLGEEGDACWDDNYIYVKTSAGWKRTAALSTF